MSDEKPECLVCRVQLGHQGPCVRINNNTQYLTWLASPGVSISAWVPLPHEQRQDDTEAKR